MTKKTQQQRFLSKFFDTYVHMYRNDDLPPMRVPSLRLIQLAEGSPKRNPPRRLDVRFDS